MSQRPPDDPSKDKKTEVSMPAIVIDVQEPKATIMNLPGFGASVTDANAGASPEESWSELHEATSIQPVVSADDGKTALQELPPVEEILRSGEISKPADVMLPDVSMLASLTPSEAAAVAAVRREEELPEEPLDKTITPNSTPGSLEWVFDGKGASDVMVLNESHESTHITTSLEDEDFSPACFDELPRYQPRGLLAKGGMGFVCRAFDKRILRSAAMKLLKPELAQQKTELQRFLSEAQITGQLEHPNIVPVYDVGVDDKGRYYFTMQMVRGRTLRNYIKESHYDPAQESSLFKALQIFLKVCDALAFAHSRGILHRDLKPANIMVGDYGEVYLMDWGIASVLHQKAAETRIQEPIYLSHLKEHKGLDTPGSVIGSVSYIAPEQAQGALDKLDKRTDIFSLGAILYQMLTMFPPYVAKSFPALVMKARRCEIIHPQQRAPEKSLPRVLCDIAMKAMHKDPEQRFQTVHELKERIEAFLQGDERFPRKRFAAGELIIQEGAIGDVAYGILGGRCLAYKMEDGVKVDLREMGPGEVFGEASVLGGQDRSACVTAIDDVVVVCLSRETLREAFGEDSWMGRLVQTIAVRFTDIDQQLTDLRRERRFLRLASRLLLYIHRTGKETSPYTMQASWSAISAMLGQKSMAMDELSTTVSRLEGCILDVDADTLTIDTRALELWLDGAQSEM